MGAESGVLCVCVWSDKGARCSCVKHVRNDTLWSACQSMMRHHPTTAPLLLIRHEGTVGSGVDDVDDPRLMLL